jgi:enediyne biosynthesis protein E4
VTNIRSTAIIAALLASATLAADDGAMRFTDVTASSGLGFTTTSGSTPSTQILEVKGGGLAVIDFDGDGDLDIFVPNGASLADPEHGPGARLYRNDGALRFTDVTTSSGIRLTRWSFGAAVGDVDGDGRDDIFVACFGPDVLLRNRGDGTFEDITERAGVGDRRWGTGAAFADLDLDGDLDLYVCNYVDFDPAQPLPPASFKGQPVIAGPKGYPAAADGVYENRGDGTFIDRSADSGVAAVRPGYGLNAAIADFTGDGRPDIFVGNDSQENNLLSASVPWRFTDNGLRSGVAVNGEGSAQATMGIAVADIDGNGRPDIFTTNFSSDANTLHLNLDGRSFDDRTNQFGLGAPSRPLVGWAAGFFDFDHDGDEDLLVLNGHVYPQATKASMDSDYAQRPLLMERRGGRFLLAESSGSWQREPKVDRSAVFADLDQDGDVDFVIAGLNQPLRVVRNDHDTKDDWLTVVPTDSRQGVGNRHAVGSVVTLRQGERVQRRWLIGGGPFQSNHAPEAYFGLGGATGPIGVEVAFADGTVVRRDDVKPGTRLVMAHPGAKAP